jgi:hypothetical protein
MHFSVTLRSLILLMLLLGVAPAAVQAADSLAGALEASERGDDTAAMRQLSNLIDSGSQDPRVYLARGLVADRLGMPPDADLRRAAALEAATGNSSALNLLLDDVGGPLREKIEKFRFEARASLKPDSATEKLKGVFREALELRRTGSRAAALEKFQQLTSNGTDPRYFYMHGVVLAESGDTTAASEMFSEALKRETSLREMQLVNELLAGVSPRARLLIEEQAKVEVGGEVITRRLLRDELRRRALMSEEQLLAETNAAAAAAEREASAAAESRRRSAVEQILAERARDAAKQQQMAEVLPGQNTAPAEPSVAAADNAPKPSAPTTTPTPSTTPSAPKNTANPFLSGAAVPSRPRPSGNAPANPAGAAPAPAALNAEWLPANSELILALRPADMASSPVVQSAGGLAAIDAAVPPLQTLGLSIGDIESVTIAVTDVFLAFGPMVTQAAAGAAPDPALLQQQLAQKAIAVVRLSKDFDAAAIAASQNATSASENGTTWYKVPAAQPDQPESAWFAPDARTMVAGSEQTIKKAIANGAGEAALENFTFVPGDAQIALAFSSPLLVGLSAGMNAPENSPPFVVNLADSVKGKISGAALTLNYSQDIDLSILLNLIDEESSAEAQKALSETLAFAKQTAPLLLGSLPQPLIPGVQAAVNSLAGSNRASVLTLSAKIPQSLVDAIQQNPGLLAPNGIPGAPGAPGLPGGIPLPQ